MLVGLWAVREVGGRPRQKEERKRKQARRDYRSEASLDMILSTRGSQSSPRKEGASQQLHRRDERNALSNPRGFLQHKGAGEARQPVAKAPRALSQRPGPKGREVLASPPAFINKIQNSTLTTIPVMSADLR